MRSAEALKPIELPGWRSGDRPEQNLERIVRTLELRVPGMRGHSRRVAVYAALTAQRIGLDRVEIDRVRRAAAIHDIGKVEVPVEVLNHPGGLADEEFARIQRHAVAGAAIVAELGDPELTEIVRHHHERFDGEGYPDGLAGEEIPIGARIVAVADTFDAVHLGPSLPAAADPSRGARPARGRSRLAARPRGRRRLSHPLLGAARRPHVGRAPLRRSRPSRGPRPGPRRPGPLAFGG